MQYLICNLINQYFCKKKCHWPISFPTGLSIKYVGKFWSFLTPPLSYQPILNIDFFKKNVVNLKFLPSLTLPLKLPTSFMDGSYRFQKRSVFTKLTEIFQFQELQISYSTGKLWLKTGIKSQWAYFSAIVQITDYGRPERKQPSLHGRKFTPTPNFLGTAEAYFVCHIGPIFQISLIYAFIMCPQSVACYHFFTICIIFQSHKQ